MTTRKRILVVEDEDDIAILLGKRLRSEGYAVTRVSDGVQAMQQAMRMQPKLILLDLMLPGGGGVGVLTKLRRSFLTQDIPVVILTGMQDAKYEATAKEFGVEAYFRKPYDPVALLAEIERLIGRAVEPSGRDDES